MSARMITPARSGFTLIETMVAMLLGGVILLALAPPLIGVARQQHVFQQQTARDGALQTEAARYATMSFDELPEDDDCVVVDGGGFPHTRCVTVIVSSTTSRKLAVVITPHNPGLPADTVTIQRSRPRGNPFDRAGPF